jgi:proliferating cell nuclear antigen PCNA
MKLSIEPMVKIQKIFESLKDLDIIETNININKECLKIECMNNHHTCLMGLQLGKSYFNDFLVNDVREVGIQLLILTKLLRAGQPNDKLDMIFQDDILELIITSGERTQHFEIPYLDIEQDSLHLDDSHYKGRICMNPQDFIHIVNNISLIEGDDCLVSIIDDKLKLESKGSLGTSKIIHNIDKEYIDFDNEGKKISNRYSVVNLKRFNKSCTINNNNIEIQMISGFPIKLMIHIDNTSYLKYYIAPKDE